VAVARGQGVKRNASKLSTEWKLVVERRSGEARQQESNLTPLSNKECSSTSAPTQPAIDTFIKCVPNLDHKFDD
jgi:hypothetical protein